MQLREYCNTERGMQSRLAEALGIRRSYFNQIVTGYRPIPIEYAAQIEKETKGEVTRKEMFPTNWMDIWPELRNGKR